MTNAATVHMHMTSAGTVYVTDAATMWCCVAPDVALFYISDASTIGMTDAMTSTHCIPA